MSQTCSFVRHRQICVQVGCYGAIMARKKLSIAEWIDLWLGRLIAALVGAVGALLCYVGIAAFDTVDITFLLIGSVCLLASGLLIYFRATLSGWLSGIAWPMPWS